MFVFVCIILFNSEVVVSFMVSLGFCVDVWDLNNCSNECNIMVYF